MWKCTIWSGLKTIFLNILSCCGCCVGNRNRLNTKNRLQKWGIVNDDCCVLCNTGVETADHLFFSCVYSAYVWTRIQAACLVYRGSSEWNMEVQPLNHHLKRNPFGTVIMKLALAAVIYLVWKERNARTFSNKLTEADNTLIECLQNTVKN